MNSITKLLPVSTDQLLRSRKERISLLSMLTVIIEELLEAIHNFINKNYRNFDAQVGETLCQIRAYKICVLGNDINFKTELENFHSSAIKYELAAKECLQQIINESSKAHYYEPNLDSKETISNFLIRLGINFSLNKDQLFIVTSYFLAKYCITDVNYFPCAINYNTIKDKFNIGMTAARNLANHYQLILAKLSCDFILSNQLSSFKHQQIIVKAMIKDGDKSRKAAPYYLATKLLLQSKLVVQVPIVILIKIFSHSHYGNNDNTHHVLILKRNTLTNSIELTEDKSIMNLPCVVFSGVSFNEKNISFKEYKQKILNIGIEKIILYNAASHPQFTGDKLAKYSSSPFKDLILQDKPELKNALSALKEEFSIAKKNAFSTGCAKNNPTLFHIQHIFCSSTDNYVNARGIPVFRNEGNDMKQKQANNDLSLDELDFIEIFLTLSPGHIYWKNLKGEFQGCNQLQAVDAGLASNKDIIGKTDYDMPWKEDADFLRAVDAQVVKNGEPIVMEEKSKTADGRNAIWLSRKAPLKNKHGKIVGIIGISLDITDRREKEQLILESKVHQATKEEQDKFKRVAGQVLHDMGAPLASIRAIVDSIHEIPEKKRIALRTSTMNISDIANQLLNQFKPHNNDEAEVNRRQPILVSAIQAEVLSDRRFKYKNKPITFECKLTQFNAFIFIKAQPLNFKRSISNLINNAIDSLPANGGKIEFGLKADEEWVYVSILDDGCGIPNNVLDKIKDSSAVTEGKRDGHGIGLTQVHDMLEQNYGTMEIISSIHEKSHGTTVTLRFPRAAAPDWMAKGIELTKDSIIVILDDNTDIHKIWELRLGSILEKMPSITIKYFIEGQDVIEFIEQLSEIKRNNVCLLSDYELINQELNGLQVIKQCKVKYSILVTSYFADLDIRKIAIQGGIRILPKGLAHLVPLKIVQLRTKDELANVHMVFVDDDKTIMQTLVAEYYNHLIVDQYSNPFEFLNEVDKYPHDTKLIFDNYYYADDGSTLNIDGITMARKLHEKGYTKLFLLSGEEFSVPEYLTLILKTDKEKIRNLDKL